MMALLILTLLLVALLAVWIGLPSKPRENVCDIASRRFHIAAEPWWGSAGSLGALQRSRRDACSFHMDSLRQSFVGHEIAWNHFVQGYLSQMRGDVTEAIALYNRSLASHPTAEAFTFLGWAYSFRGEIEKAIVYCEKAIETDADFGNPYNDIGAYLLQLGRPREAIGWLQRAVQAARYDSPHFPHVNMGAAYEALEETEKAIDCYKRALAFEPDYNEAQTRLLRLIGQMN